MTILTFSENMVRMWEKDLSWTEIILKNLNYYPEDKNTPHIIKKQNKLFWGYIVPGEHLDRRPHSHSLAITLALLSDDQNQPWVTTSTTHLMTVLKTIETSALSLQCALHLVSQQLLGELLHFFLVETFRDTFPEWSTGAERSCCSPLM